MIDFVVLVLRTNVQTVFPLTIFLSISQFFTEFYAQTWLFAYNRKLFVNFSKHLKQLWYDRLHVMKWYHRHSCVFHDSTVIIDWYLPMILLLELGSNGENLQQNRKHDGETWSGRKWKQIDASCLKNCANIEYINLNLFRSRRKFGNK